MWSVMDVVEEKTRSAERLPLVIVYVERLIVVIQPTI